MGNFAAVNLIGNEMNAFTEWVADTVVELGGNRPACLQYLQRKYALTFQQDRIPDVSSYFFNYENVDAMRLAVRARTNLMVLH